MTLTRACHSVRGVVTNVGNSIPNETRDFSARMYAVRTADRRQVIDRQSTQREKPAKMPLSADIGKRTVANVRKSTTIRLTLQ